MNERCPVCDKEPGTKEVPNYPAGNGSTLVPEHFAFAGGTCSQECARTLVIVEVGRELLKLLRVLACPVYYSTPEGDVTPVPPGQVGPRHSWPAAEPAPHPTDEEQ